MPKKLRRAQQKPAEAAPWWSSKVTTCAPLSLADLKAAMDDFAGRRDGPIIEVVSKAEYDLRVAIIRRSQMRRVK